MKPGCRSSNSLPFSSINRLIPLSVLFCRWSVRSFNVWRERNCAGFIEQFLKIILPFTQQKNGLAGTDSPLRVYLACYLALETTHATDDAQRVLKPAYNLLQTRAANIEDPVVRLSFLKNIPHHRAILAAWQKMAAFLGDSSSLRSSE